MFNLNECNRFFVSRRPTDMRKGPNMLCGEIRAYGLDPSNGDVYVFIGASRHIMKLLVWESGGYTQYYKRLEMGRIAKSVFHDGGGGFRPMDWDELVLFVMGVSPNVHRRKRIAKVSSSGNSPKMEPEDFSQKNMKKNCIKPWLSR